MNYRGARGFSIRDMCFGLAALAVVGALVVAGSAGARKRSQLAAAQNQLRWIAGVTTSYAADFEDRMWGLSWREGELPHSTPGLPTIAGSSLMATAVQAIDLLHRRAGRTDIPVPSSWYTAAMYSHLPLLDYLDRDGPDLSFVSPGDKHRLNWTKDPQELHDQGFWQPYQEPWGGAGPVPVAQRRWPYSSSFQTPPVIVSTPVEGSDAVSQGSSHPLYWAPSGATFQGCNLASVAYPAQKVLLHESSSWYTGAEFRYYADPRASINVLTADGSARLLATEGTNHGWRPGSPTSSGHTLFTYEPRIWEGPRPPVGESRMIGRYRFTRGALAGRDFGGPEVDTGQP